MQWLALVVVALLPAICLSVETEDGPRINLEHRRRSIDQLDRAIKPQIDAPIPTVPGEDEVADSLHISESHALQKDDGNALPVETLAEAADEVGKVNVLMPPPVNRVMSWLGGGSDRQAPAAGPPAISPLDMLSTAFFDRPDSTNPPANAKEPNADLIEDRDSDPPSPTTQPSKRRRQRRRRTKAGRAPNAVLDDVPLIKTRPTPPKTSTGTVVPKPEDVAAFVQATADFHGVTRNAEQMMPVQIVVIEDDDLFAQDGDFNRYFELFAVKYENFTAVYYAYTRFNEPINGPHFAYILDEQTAKFNIKPTPYLLHPDESKAQLFQCTDQMLYYFEETGIVTLKTPLGFNCEHAFTYGSIMFMNVTHFIQMNTNDGYINAEDVAPRHKSILRSDIRKTVKSCFRKRHFCTQGYPTNMAVLSDRQYTFFMHNIEVYSDISRLSNNTVDITFIAEVYGSHDREEHEAFTFPMNLKTFSNQIVPRFERFAMIPLIQESDNAFIKYQISALTDAEMVQEMEVQRKKAFF